MKGLKKGQTNNPNGRPKGKPNKITKDLRAAIQDFIDNNIDQIQSDYEALTPKERLTFMEKLFAYSVPKLQSVNQTIQFEQLSDDQLDKLIDELTKKVQL